MVKIVKKLLNNNKVYFISYRLSVKTGRDTVEEGPVLLHFASEIVVFVGLPDINVMLRGKLCEQCKI